jgi:hypothetical protein
VDGRRIPTADVTGVYTRLPCVSEQDLPHIEAQDRAYVAAEMTAFLLSWLSELRCPVVNRPSGSCLCGPSWRFERWVHFAGERGIAIRPIRRHHRYAPLEEPEATASSALVDVTVVGRRWFGDCDPQLGAQALELARGAGADLLDVTFDVGHAGARVIGAHVWPDVSLPGPASALRQLLVQSR